MTDDLSLYRGDSDHLIDRSLEFTGGVNLRSLYGKISSGEGEYLLFP